MKFIQFSSIRQYVSSILKFSKYVMLVYICTYMYLFLNNYLIKIFVNLQLIVEIILIILFNIIENDFNCNIPL